VIERKSDAKLAKEVDFFFRDPRDLRETKMGKQMLKLGGLGCAEFDEIDAFESKGIGHDGLPLGSIVGGRYCQKKDHKLDEYCHIN
jgi:hypothetical protein